MALAQAAKMVLVVFRTEAGRPSQHSGNGATAPTLLFILESLVKTSIMCSLSFTILTELVSAVQAFAHVHNESGSSLKFMQGMMCWTADAGTGFQITMQL